MTKLKKTSKHFPIIIGLFLIALILPLVLSLVQKTTENRSRAAIIEDKCPNGYLLTAYYPANNSMEGGFYDAFDHLLVKMSTVAVDPNVIPFGSQFKIEGFGDTVFTALDKGSAIKNCHIDICMSENEAVKFKQYNKKITYVGMVDPRSGVSVTSQQETVKKGCSQSCFASINGVGNCSALDDSDYSYSGPGADGSCPTNGALCCTATKKSAPVVSAPVVDNNKYYCSTGDVGKSQCTASTGDWAEVDNKTDNVLKKTWGSDAIGDCKNTCAATKPVSTCKTSCDAGSGLVHSAVANPNSLGGTTANSECTNSGFQNNASCKNINNGVAGCDDAFNCCSCEAKIYDCTAKACSNNYGCMRNGDFKSSTEDCANPIGTVNRTYDENCPKRNGAGGGNDDNCKNDNTSSTCTKKSLGDANCDGKVNENDYNIWIRELQKTDTTVTADFNSDGAVDGTDFSIWNKNLEK